MDEQTMTEHTVSTREDWTTALAAARSQTGVVALFLGAAALAWWWTARRMAGMDAGPGTALGALDWFVGVWVVMMAAMMLPSLAPTAAVHAGSPAAHADPTGAHAGSPTAHADSTAAHADSTATGPNPTHRSAATPARALWTGGAPTAGGRLARSALFAAGYLLVWTAVGLAVYAAFALGRDLLAPQLAWDSAGRWVAGGVLALAAAYELTPWKAACLARCGSPATSTHSAARERPAATLLAGARNGCWCLGCSGALMAALFALGVMSLTWMALLAALVALQKLAPRPRRRAAATLTSALLLALAVAMLAAPHDVPGLVVPGGPMHAMGTTGGPAHAMHTMGPTHAMHTTGGPTSMEH